MMARRSPGGASLSRIFQASSGSLKVMRRSGTFGLLVRSRSVVGSGMLDAVYDVCKGVKAHEAADQRRMP